MTLRPQLLNSLCCQPGCTSAIADFTYTTLNVDIGESITFTNTSTGAISNNWKVEGNMYDDIIDLIYQFNNFGSGGPETAGDIPSICSQLTKAFILLTTPLRTNGVFLGIVRVDAIVILVLVD